MLGNVGTIICGRIGVTDAELMVKAFSPTFTAEDLTKTPNFAAVAKVMMFDMPSTPFTISLPAPMGQPNDALMDNLKLLSSTKYAKTRQEVEKEIEARWNSANVEKAADAVVATETAANAISSAEKPQAPSKTPAESPVEAPGGASDEEDGFLDGWLNKTA